MEHYQEYYENQVGGRGGIEHVYIGTPNQRGHGVGSFLGGIFRKILPLFSRGARAVGKEALRSGLNILSDVGHNTPFKEAFKARVRESGDNLKRKANEKIDLLMRGSGYNELTGKRITQSMIARLPIRTKKRRRGLKSKNKKKTRKGAKKNKKSKLRLTKKKNRAKKKKQNKRKTKASSKKASPVDIFGNR